MRVQRWRAGFLLALAIALAPRAAHADDAATEARAAYNEGLTAHDSGDEKTAARDFARADALVPSNEALEAATASAIGADDAILGMTLVERARSRELDARATDTIERARRAFASRVTTIVVDCNGAADCTVEIDNGVATDAHAPLLVLSGKHDVVVLRDKTRQIVSVSADGGEVVRVVLAPAQARSTTDPAPSDSTSITRPIAFAAIGATLVLGGISLASAVDAKAKRTDFDHENCGVGAPATTSPGADCNQLSASGSSAQARTNWLLAGTAFAAAATLAFVIVARPFGSRSNVAVSASLGSVNGALTF